ncbi:M23 family metallopeptidase [Paludifilum halophilum]|uniref:M23ase beta-sheet core domain-containing protein n=1 Tax=Paludifilum halophilum TaxID=1642702 RepID=A0A235B8D4_9BACL|nr:M23 family metallopeptidase [Paludifilum halophilum]OYD08249.1 hypothetical protein CHM34_05190 [Paludifilum halophilum]
MREWYQGVKKRRERQMKAIRDSQYGTGAGWGRYGQPVWQKRETGKSEDLPWNRPGQWMEESEKKKEGRWVVQAFFAFFLLTGTYLVFQSQVPAGKQVQAFITEVMERDYNFRGVAQWYQENIDGSPAILPTFREKNEQEKSEQRWIAPVKGELTGSFKKEDRGVTLRTSEQAPVVSAAEGWVVEAGRKEGLGLTVVVRHTDGRETWYGWLKEIRVKEKDWVKPEQLLGETGGRDGEPLLFFALKRGDQFVDPTKVITFE